MEYITTPTVSEILREEFMEPLGISAYRLAQSINVPVSRVQDILHDRRKITADTSLRLAKFFGVSDRYFLDMQMKLPKFRFVRLDDNCALTKAKWNRIIVLEKQWVRWLNCYSCKKSSLFLQWC